MGTGRLRGSADTSSALTGYAARQVSGQLACFVGFEVFSPLWAGEVVGQCLEYVAQRLCFVGRDRGLPRFFF